MPITEHSRRAVFKGADGNHWMIVRPGEISLPQYIEGIAKGWLVYEFQFNCLTMQVRGEARKYKDGSISHGYYFVGDREKRFIDRSIKQPSAQK